MRFFRRNSEPTPTPQWLIVGLGNPGPEYRGTRHNVGFDVIDQLARRNGVKVGKGRQRALLGSGEIGGIQVLLAKPLTFMNLSGQAIAPIARSVGLKPDHILVIADDLDLPVGKVKMRMSGGAGGHNGHKSLIQYLASNEYPRIKIGIGKVDRSSTVDHVLSPFHPEERPLIDEAIQRVVETCEKAVTDGVEAALNFLAT